MFDTIMGMLTPLFKDVQAGRMIESVVLLAIIWSKLKPHLTKIEDRLKGVELALQTGFNLRDERIQKNEARLTALENKELIRGRNEKFSSV